LGLDHVPNLAEVGRIFGNCPDYSLLVDASRFSPAADQGIDGTHEHMMRDDHGIWDFIDNDFLQTLANQLFHVRSFLTIRWEKCYSISASHVSNSSVQRINVGTDVFTIGPSFAIWTGRLQVVVAAVSLIEINESDSFPVLREKL